ncbi:ATP-dependent RNA helicase DDX50 [Hondaea fermentalgiana]|uniref:ATP-dependent RNA helicase DDX50 n=1 Tax=Hondaea fermentalgiana TaxID=2315210 RepID=A0A2R5GRZ9_9STRA|nr:ATP-dependent RNA helicase DDX50 [Hondaea fermentalgiana]|eukprot:GBG33079.1 ATP-dependent RNA helicase DDX50 [Hondaea fermentalgiana]
MRTKASVPEPRDHQYGSQRLSLSQFDDLFEDELEEAPKRGTPGKRQNSRAPLARFSRDFEEENDEFSQTDDLEIVKKNAFKMDDESDSISEFDLHPSLKKSLRKQGIEHLFPVQMRTFNAVSAGEDMIVRSRTGSGKTLAFGLPVINALLSEPSSRKPKGTPSAIVMAPTRELAKQVQVEFEKVAPSLRCISVYGGADIGPQIRDLSKPVDVVIGTPGRIYDHLQNGRLDLSMIRFAILDEADEMLKVGFKDQIDEIYEYMPPKAERQNLLFSATVAPEIRHVARKHLNNGKLIDLVGDDNAKIPDSIEMQAIKINGPHRSKALANVLSLYCKGSEPKRALVFCPTKAMCNEVATSNELADVGIKSVAMHGDMSQTLRESTLKAFRDGRVQCMVATDVAARGLDIPQVDLVIHFSIPSDKDSFVHRTGRTGRAGRSGRNIVMFNHREERDLDDLEKLVGIKFMRHAVPGSHALMSAASSDLAEKIEAVTAYDIASFNDLAEDMVAEAAQDGLVTQEQAVAMVAKVLAVSGRSSNTFNVSALSGDADRVTLELQGEEYARAAGTSNKINFVRLRRVMEEIVQASMAETGDANLVRSVTPGRGAVMLAAVSRDRKSVFIDVNPAVASHLLSHPDCTAVDGEVPSVLMPPRRSGGDSFRRDSRKREQRFDAKRNPVFGRKTKSNGFRNDYNNNNNNNNSYDDFFGKSRKTRSFKKRSRDSDDYF